jgi:hypothetical protein
MIHDVRYLEPGKKEKNWRWKRREPAPRPGFASDYIAANRRLLFLVTALDTFRM